MASKPSVVVLVKLVMLFGLQTSASWGGTECVFSTHSSKELVSQQACPKPPIIQAIWLLYKQSVGSRLSRKLIPCRGLAKHAVILPFTIGQHAVNVFVRGTLHKAAAQQVAIRPQMSLAKFTVQLSKL